MAISPRRNFIEQQRTEKKRPEIVDFSRDIFDYSQIRFRQFRYFSYALYLVISEFFGGAKKWTVRRMFWGRSSLYRSAFHVMVLGITLIAVISGLSTRISLVSADQVQGLDLSTGIIGRNDIFSQSGTVESIGAVGKDEKDYPEYIHIVEQDQTLSQIATLYKISESTIKWANSLSSSTIKVGQALRIPGIDGVFVKVVSGDTLEKIAAKYKGNVADIVDLNSHILDYKNPALTEGMELFIPSGEIPPPPKAVTKVVRKPSTNSAGNTNPGVDVPSGTFVHPLQDGGCSGHRYSRGFTSWHSGVDLAKKGGCWINSVAAGTVTKAGWSSGGPGYMVEIDHGNGFKTHYYHGNGEYAVRSGQSVKAGQTILYMGTTGNSTGTHLHLSLFYKGKLVNPETYISGLR